MTDMTVKKDPGTLAVEIRTLQQQAQVVVLSYAIEIGRRLCEAKAALSHGQWGEWLENEVNFSQSSANNYMKVYERYGSEQLNLFGDTKSETLGNLPYTKALKLLAVPEDEVEEFLEENDVEHMSTRELEQAIRERDEARADLQKEREAGVALAIKADRLRETAEEAREEAERLREQIQQLENRPVEVAVQAPTEEMFEEIRAKAEADYAAEKEKLEKKLEKAEKRAQAAEKQAAEAKESVKKAKETAKAELQQDIDAARHVEAEKIRLEAENAELQKRLRAADTSTAQFQIYFQRVQEDCNRMLGLIQKADAAQGEKFRTAMRTLLNSLGNAL